MSKDQFLDLSDWDLMNWIGRPSFYNDSKKPYWPAPRVDPTRPDGKPITWRDLYMMSAKAKAMRVMGATEAELEEAYQTWISDHVNYRRPPDDKAAESSAPAEGGVTFRPRGVADGQGKT